MEDPGLSVIDRSGHWLVVIAGLIACFHAVPIQARESSGVLSHVDVYQKKVGDALKSKVEAAGLTWPLSEIYIRVFKHELALELWGRNQGAQPFTRVATYPTAPLPFHDLDANPPDKLGPKRKKGDLKVPEGCYRLLFHNPWSNFHLSLALGYPNAADAIRAERAGIVSKEGKEAVFAWWRQHLPEIRRRLLGGRPSVWDGPATPIGNDIFIHGGMATIGCIPIGDAAIEELFAITDPRRVGGTPVHIFPCRFDLPGNPERIERIRALSPSLAAFWDTLKPVYTIFETTRHLPLVKVNRLTGDYVANPPADPTDLIEI